MFCDAIFGGAPWTCTHGVVPFASFSLISIYLYLANQINSFQVCAGEQVKIHPMLVERFVDHCQGDIRKTIMYLQFWCQGQTLEQGNSSNINKLMHALG